MMTSKITFRKIFLASLTAAAMMAGSCSETHTSTVNTVDGSGDTLTQTTVTKTESKLSLPVTDTNGSETQKTDAKFVVTTEAGPSAPKSTIEILYNGKTTFISKVNGEVAMIDRSDYSTKGIPENAVSACDASSTEAGNYFYFVIANGNVIVYQAKQEKSAVGKDLQWKKVKEIPQ